MVLQLHAVECKLIDIFLPFIFIGSIVKLRCTGGVVIAFPDAIFFQGLQAFIGAAQQCECALAYKP
jgi:hypothetical protein